MFQLDFGQSRMLYFSFYLTVIFVCNTLNEFCVPRQEVWSHIRINSMTLEEWTDRCFVRLWRITDRLKTETQRMSSCTNCERTACPTSQLFPFSSRMQLVRKKSAWMGQGSFCSARRSRQIPILMTRPLVHLLENVFSIVSACVCVSSVFLYILKHFDVEITWHCF